MCVWRNQNKMHLFTSVLLFCFLEVNALFFQFQILPFRLQVKTEDIYIYIYIYIERERERERNSNVMRKIT